jgi:hypothetical protein
LGQDVTDKAQRVALLTEAKNEAMKLSEMKDTFVANVSHEACFRTIAMVPILFSKTHDYMYSFERP